MSYCFSKKVTGKSFPEVVDAITENLKEQGFGVLTTIKAEEIFKNKLGEEFRKYWILGACNPAFAFRAIQSEHNIGTMLPCSVVVQEYWQSAAVEVAVVDPVASMEAVDNQELKEMAGEVRDRLKKTVENLH